MKRILFIAIPVILWLSVSGYFLFVNTGNTQTPTTTNSSTIQSNLQTIPSSLPLTQDRVIPNLPKNTPQVYSAPTYSSPTVKNSFPTISVTPKYTPPAYPTPTYSTPTIKKNSPTISVTPKYTPPAYPTPSYAPPVIQKSYPTISVTPKYTSPAYSTPSYTPPKTGYSDSSPAWNYSSNDVDVKGYYRKDGTYVQPYSRTKPDSTLSNNYGYRGNYNPNTGKISK
jgi:hypothetical protein